MGIIGQDLTQGRDKVGLLLEFVQEIKLAPQVVTVQEFLRLTRALLLHQLAALRHRSCGSSNSRLPEISRRRFSRSAPSTSFFADVIRHLREELPPASLKLTDRKVQGEDCAVVSATLISRPMPMIFLTPVLT
jgi:hypothetical protein